MKTHAARLEAIEVLDDRDGSVTIGTAWREQPALLVFIRHFG